MRIRSLINSCSFGQAAKIIITLQFVFFLFLPNCLYAIENQGVGGRPAYPREKIQEQNQYLFML